MTVSHKGLSTGQRASIDKVFTSKAVAEYTALTGDTSFEAGTVPGPLLGGMVSNLLGTRLPGRGTMWLKQRYAFPASARVGDGIIVTVEITRIRPEKDLVNLSVTGMKQNGEVVCRGEALVLVADLESAKV